MTDTHTPATCHYDRTLGYRVTARHTDTCARDQTCPGHRGCQPCDRPHCAVCGREHATLAQPQTCPDCQGKIDDDLTDIQASYALLGDEALHAGHNGHLVAAAPIPGGDAAVLVGPTVRLDLARTSRTLRDDHRRTDPLPPLAILAQWEDIYRAYLGHDQEAAPTKTARWGDLVTTPRRATISGSVKYLRDQLPYIAQRTDGPDFLAFTRQIRRIRATLEGALHDEREDEHGVECFECGEELVRRFRDPKRCRHRTEARRDLQAWLHRRAAAVDWLRTLRTYPELGEVRIDDLRAAASPPASLVAAARMPCGACSKAWKDTQGGLDDPRAGRSWECPGCRKEYTPGEYSTAVRTSLVNGVDGTGWCTLQTAADAATDITGRPVSPAVIRVWIGRGDDIAICCWWKVDARAGVQLVFWPDVLHRATEFRSRSARSGRITA